MNLLHRTAPCVARPVTLAFYMPNLGGGGVQKSMLRLAGALCRRGYVVDIVVDEKQGPQVENASHGARIVELGRGSDALANFKLLRAFPGDFFGAIRPIFFARRRLVRLEKLLPLADYLATTRPAVIISAPLRCDLLAIWARDLAGVDSRVIATVRIVRSRASTKQSRNKARRWRYMNRLIGQVLRRASAIVSVSNGVADDLAATTGLPRHAITTIYNPVVSPEMIKQASKPVAHPFFGDDVPVIMAAGRLAKEKNFTGLLEAFARIRSDRPARLLILGEGPEQDNLRCCAERLGVAADVALPGWVNNPYAYMRQARVLVLSSFWEGLPSVLIEALACGCPVVATDCPSGPREILANGRYGRLVPVDNRSEMVRAIQKTLDEPPAAPILRQRANEFSMATGVDCYEQLMQRLMPSGPAGARRAS